mmetsp:Transcript_11732/g.42861  ORF Transcript_11732/g.42861 Transcript_11732/m.42861 type:complete len:96 (+) Transcript_11732:279-566(+)
MQAPALVELEVKAAEVMITVGARLVAQEGENRADRGKPQVAQEAEKVVVVVAADADVEPRAVVIHAQHAAAAHLAMVREGRFNAPAACAVLCFAA